MPEAAPFKWHHAETPDELEAFYKSVLPKITAAARDCGYAIGVHGSMRRDLDLIAAPWVADHADKDTLARAIQMAACGIHNDSFHWGNTPPKPCGRMATSFAICWSSYKNAQGQSGGHIDLSVMPDTDTQPDSAETKEVCPNCDSPMPEGCAGLFKGEGKSCWLNKLRELYDHE